MTRSLLFALFFLSAGCSSLPKELPVVARPPETGATTAQSQKKRKPVVLTKKHILKRFRTAVFLVAAFDLSQKQR